MADCIFCGIAAGEIPSTCVHNEDGVYAFKDINPQAPVHILVMPIEHIESAAAITKDNSVLTAKCFEVIARLAVSENLIGGFRVITNSGKDAGQTVPHLHFHLLAGRDMGDSLL